ncbi:MAG: helix-turn-helix transcriptional regulator, partial [Mycobacterium sp.]
VGAACAERMWHLTRGNVLFLRQLVTQEYHAGRLVSRDGTWQWVGTMEVSQSLVDLVNLRIGAAPEPVLEVIDSVALAEPLELAYLTALAEASVIEDAERRGLITVSRTTPSGVVSLGHPLYGEVRLAQAGQLRLERLRGRIVRKMVALDEAVGRPDPVRLALLWLQSDLAPDHDVFTQAAQAAFRGLDMALAERLADAALAAGAGVDSALLRANALTLIGRGAEADEVLKSVTDKALPEPIWSTAVNLRGVNLLWTLAQPEQAHKLIDDALAGASEPVTQRLSAFRAVQLAVEARPAEALRICESIDRADLGALSTLVRTWAQIIALGDLGQPLLAAEIAGKATPLAAGSQGTAYYQTVILMAWYTQALILGGCLLQARAVADRTTRQCADAPGRSQTFAAAINGRTALGCGDLRTAVERLGYAVAKFAGDTDGSSYHFGIEYAEALARRGDVDAAAEALADIERREHPAAAFRESDRLLAAAWLLSARGRTSQSQALAREAAAFACTHGQHAREVVCLQAAIQFGDRHTAARLAELAGLVEGPRADLVARWAAALDDHDGEALLAVSYDLEAMGDRIGAADAAAHSSLVFRRKARVGPALTAGGRAERLIADCGAVTLATKAAAMPLPLSDREREIAVLIAQGLSNSEIAEALTLSVRTIEGHIYRSCSRVGMTTRTELAQLITDFSPAEDSARSPGRKEH